MQERRLPDHYETWRPMNSIEQQNAIAVATIQVEVAHLKAAFADVRADSAQQNAKLDKVLEQLNEARGGWRVMMLFGTAAATLGSGLGWLISRSGG